MKNAPGAETKLGAVGGDSGGVGHYADSDAPTESDSKRDRRAGIERAAGESSGLQAAGNLQEGRGANRLAGGGGDGLARCNGAIDRLRSAASRSWFFAPLLGVAVL